MLIIERGTVQEIRITIRGLDLSESDVYVTFKQDTGKSLTRDTMTSVVYSDNRTVITLTLTQKETMLFDDNRPGKVQVRWVDAQGNAHKTKTAPFVADELLYNVVLERSGDDNA